MRKRLVVTGADAQWKRYQTLTYNLSEYCARH